MSLALEKDAEEVHDIEETGTGTEKILQYSFYEEVKGREIFNGHLSLYIEQDHFRARGDYNLLTDYFAENNIQELQIEQ